ncbi:PREDICTED: coiled-coil domain-containing protein 63 [Polistes dominula]|uniref:Coiled-coil domain-containing protein 63 n=1 Tax=Polistes dominula TaxID=743375 RepID=A0ABM1IUV3_POLDO|nr:PREDICTED: coiled-coil domain-containing protein 63 [Polistes dominula]
MQFLRTSSAVKGALEMETMPEVELTRLRRQYRIMENDRLKCAEEGGLQLRNQQIMIARLEYEKAELLLAIRSAKSKKFLKKDEADDIKLKELFQQRSKYIDSIKSEKQQISELNRQIRQISKEVSMLRGKSVTDVQSKENAVKHNKLVFILENRLEVATRRFNTVVSENAKLRGEIETLLKERAQFTTLWNKLIGQLNTGKQIINDLIEQATVTFNQRDEEMNKIQALRERATRDLNAHTAEMCELQRTLDNEMKLQEFLGVKGQYRRTVDLHVKQEAERAAKRREQQDKIATYMHILETIKEFTGESNIDRIVAHFVKQEEENFALFNYVNELNDEMESLQLKMAELTVAIDEARALHEFREKQQAETLETITNQLEEQTKLADDAEEELSKCDDEIEKMLKGIEALFKAVKCDNSPILQLLGDNSHVTMGNVMLYLGIIEKRITEMMHKVYWVDKATKSQQLRLDEDKKPRLKIPSLTQIAPTQPCALCVEKEEMQIMTEGLEIPLSREEAIEKLKQHLEDDYSELLHNVSGCHLPAARKIMQKRYQE